MSVKDKIQEAKECFKEIEKKGVNNYQNFKYIELKELNPLVRQVCKQYKLRTHFDWDVGYRIMYLHVEDQEDGGHYEARIPVAPITAADPGKYMQDVGRVQTYAQRYLYFQVFEISVPDEIDNKDARKSESTTSKNNTQSNITVPEDASEELKQLVTQIKKDFKGKVALNKNTLKNKLGSMKKSQRISDSLYNEALQLTK